MDRSNKITSIEELYKRLLPAINTKLSELKRKNITYIKNIDIWNFCADNIWKTKKDLRIYEMVSDILNIDIFEIKTYINKKDEINEK